MKSIISIAIGFWIARELTSQYHKRRAKEIQLRQKRKLEAFFKAQDFSQTQIKEYTQAILNQ